MRGTGEPVSMRKVPASLGVGVWTILKNLVPCACFCMNRSLNLKIDLLPLLLISSLILLFLLFLLYLGNPPSLPSLSRKLPFLCSPAPLTPTPPPHSASPLRSQLGSQYCTSCPPGTTTEGIGSSSHRDCKLCKENRCGHGSCSVSQTTFDLRCSCDFGYSGASCNFNHLAANLGSAMAVLAFALISAVAYRAYKRRVRVMREENALQERLLSEAQKELTTLMRAWEIK
jgi:hypothetical protein